MVTTLFEVVLGVMWALVWVAGAALLLPVLSAVLLLVILSKQRPQSASATPPVPYILPMIEHPNAAPGL
jgi:hypothetical protein